MSAYKKLEKLFIELNHINHVAAITGWDEAVNMPVGGGEARAQALAYLADLQHSKLTTSQALEWTKLVAEEELKDPWQKSNLKLITKQVKDAQCIPPKLVSKLSLAKSKAEQAWRRLRPTNDWQAFKPLLKEVIELCKEEAHLRADSTGLSAYDALIDQYSSGLTQKIITPDRKSVV